MEITKTLLKEFRNDLENCNKVLSEKYGIQLDVGTISFSATEFNFKTKAVVGESTKEVEQHLFNKHCRSFGYAPYDYGRTVLIRGIEHEFIGFNTRARKMPILIRSKESGSKYKIDLKTLERKLITKN